MAHQETLAKAILDVIPPSMHRIRLEMRAAAGEALTVPQFRILASIYRGQSRASDIAKHHGVSQAAMSKMIDGLVSRRLVARETQRLDRRQILLKLTRQGEAFYNRSRMHAQRMLEKRLSCLSPGEKASLRDGLEALKKIFGGAP